jgi:hypothetical protein
MKNSNALLLVIMVVLVVIAAACNKGTADKSLVVEAGPDIDVEIPITSAKLDLTVSGADHKLKDVCWNKISGPDTWAIETKSNRDSATAYWLEEGIYEFELTVMDSLGQMDKDTVKVTVASNFQKYIKNSLIPGASSTTIVEIPENIYKSLKWVYCRTAGICERTSKGPVPGINYTSGGWYYDLLPSNKISVYRGYTNEKFDLIIYY